MAEMSPEETVRWYRLKASELRRDAEDYEMKAAALEMHLWHRTGSTGPMPSAHQRLIGGLAIALMVFNASFSWAQVASQGVSDKPASTALSNVSGNCLAANPARKTLTLDNTGGTINEGYCETDPATPATPCTAVIGTPPTTTLVAGALHYWPVAPLNQFCFIAASGTPSITIKEGQ